MANVSITNYKELPYRFDIGDTVKVEGNEYQSGRVIGRFWWDNHPTYHVKMQGQAGYTEVREDKLRLFKSEPETPKYGDIVPNDDLTFKAYASAAETTIVYPNAGQNLAYPALKLCGEAGEVAEKVGKLMRDRGYRVGRAPWSVVKSHPFNQHVDMIDVDTDTAISIENDLVKELGDVLWYLYAICHELGISFEHMARTNIEKLGSRKERGTLQGSGDNR